MNKEDFNYDWYVSENAPDDRKHLCMMRGQNQKRNKKGDLLDSTMLHLSFTGSQVLEVQNKIDEFWAFENERKEKRRKHMQKMRDAREKKK